MLDFLTIWEGPGLNFTLTISKRTCLPCIRRCSRLHANINKETKDKTKKKTPKKQKPKARQNNQILPLKAIQPRKYSTDTYWIMNDWVNYILGRGSACQAGNKAIFLPRWSCVSKLNDSSSLTYHQCVMWALASYGCLGLKAGRYETHNRVQDTYMVLSLTPRHSLHLIQHHKVGPTDGYCWLKFMKLNEQFSTVKRYGESHLLIPSRSLPSKKVF